MKSTTEKLREIADNCAGSICDSGMDTDETRKVASGVIEAGIVKALDEVFEHEVVAELRRAQSDCKSWMLKYLERGDELRAIDAALSFDKTVDRDRETCARRVYAERDDARYTARHARQTLDDLHAQIDENGVTGQTDGSIQAKINAVCQERDDFKARHAETEAYLATRVIVSFETEMGNTAFAAVDKPLKVAMEKLRHDLASAKFAADGYKAAAEKAKVSAERGAQEPSSGPHSLGELLIIIKQRFGEKFTITQTERNDGAAEAVLAMDGIPRASWKSRLVGNPPRDGVTPRGPAEYYDLKFMP